jgi:CelD/BcsL family acetyltransferase involved in cellulose biosynthesis
MVATEVLTDFREVERVAPEWDTLLARSDANEPTLSPTWMLAWWRVFGEAADRRLAVVLFRESGRLVGLAPLLNRRRVERGVLPMRRIEPLASGEEEADETCSDYLGLIAEPDALHAVTEELVALLVSGSLGEWDELVIPSMAGDRRLPHLLSEDLARAGMPTVIEPAGGCAYVTLPDTWEGYLAALPSRHRYVVRRSLRDFESWAGKDAALVVAETRAELERGRRILHDLHGERWQAEGEHAGAFASDRFRRFHDAVMPALFERQALELVWLEVRGAPAAILYNVVWDDKVHFYQSGRSMDLPRKIRPGIVIHAKAIQRSIAAGRREYDFLGGDAQYKRQLATATRPLVTVQTTNPTLRTRVRDLAERGVDLARFARDEIRRRTREQS